MRLKQGQLGNLFLVFDALALPSIEALKRFVTCTTSNKWLHVPTTISRMDFLATKDTILN